MRISICLVSTLGFNGAITFQVTMLEMVKIFSAVSPAARIKPLSRKSILIFPWLTLAVPLLVTSVDKVADWPAEKTPPGD
ncbi:MAG: hypothetical protein BWY83_01982 [bacterium ADurb.Bin478]|nr:MAG: hypothetical protein BWY83_01982 [bacterium ADurb.Bin478]